MKLSGEWWGLIPQQMFLIPRRSFNDLNLLLVPYLLRTVDLVCDPNSYICYHNPSRLLIPNYDYALSNMVFLSILVLRNAFNDCEVQTTNSKASFLRNIYSLPSSCSS